MEECYVIVYYGVRYAYEYGEMKEVVVPMHESRPFSVHTHNQVHELIEEYAPKHMSYRYAKIDERYYPEDEYEKEIQKHLYKKEK